MNLPNITLDQGQKYAMFHLRTQGGGQCPIEIERFNSQKEHLNINKIRVAGWFDWLRGRSVKISFDQGKTYKFYLKNDVGQYLAGITKSKAYFKMLEEIPGKDKDERKVYSAAFNSFSSLYSKGKTTARKAQALGSHLIALTSRATYLGQSKKKKRSFLELPRPYEICQRNQGERVSPFYSLDFRFWHSIFNNIDRKFHNHLAKDTARAIKKFNNQNNELKQELEPNAEVTTEILVIASAMATGFAMGGPIGSAMAGVAAEASLSLSRRFISWWNSK